MTKFRLSFVDLSYRVVLMPVKMICEKLILGRCGVKLKCIAKESLENTFF